MPEGRPFTGRLSAVFAVLLDEAFQGIHGYLNGVGSVLAAPHGGAVRGPRIRAKWSGKARPFQGFRRCRKRLDAGLPAIRIRGDSFSLLQSYHPCFLNSII